MATGLLLLLSTGWVQSHTNLGSTSPYSLRSQIPWSALLGVGAPFSIMPSVPFGGGNLGCRFCTIADCFLYHCDLMPQRKGDVPEVFSCNKSN